MEQQLYELLRQCTMRISVPGKVGHGTGCFVAPSLILTCAHVVKAAQLNNDAVEIYWNGQPYPACITKFVSDADLALLQIDLTGHPCVLLSKEAMPFDHLYGYGYPDNYPGGDPATFILEGKAGNQGGQLKFKAGQVRPGLSGAPILNVRTGFVCGIVQLTRDRASDLGGRAISAATVFQVFPEIESPQREFHRQDRHWTNCLWEYPVRTPQGKDRQQMLKKVRTFWITDFLEQSLHHATLISLELYEQPSAVINPWRLVVQESGPTERLLPPGTTIAQVYDSSNGELLILGEPGSGKTTLLLELARDLLDRARLDSKHLIPAVFNLSSWAVKQQSITEWLIEELHGKYKVPHLLGATWVNHDHLLLLLDSLDEVESIARTNCLRAINDYRSAHPSVPLVVCSRKAEYLDQSERLHLQTAVRIQPLAQAQIEQYLISAGEQVAPLREALHRDHDLQMLATIPLMLSILLLAYRQTPLEEIAASGSLEAKKHQVFTSYVERMLKRRSLSTRYTPEQTVQWLSVLARQMQQHNQSIFYLEHMQPDWLQPKQKHIYDCVTVIIASMLIGILGSWIVLIFFSNPYSIKGIIRPGLIAAFLGFLFGQGNLIPPLGGIASQWKQLFKVARNGGLLVGLGTTLVWGFTSGSGIFDWSINGRLIAGFTTVCSCLLAGLIIQGISQIRARSPHRWFLLKHLQTTHWYVFSIGMLVGLIFVIRSDWAFWWYYWQVSVGTIFGLSYALPEGVSYGIIAMLLSIILIKQDGTIRPAETIEWSLQGLKQSLLGKRHVRNSILIAILMVLVRGLSSALSPGLYRGFGLMTWQSSIIYGFSDGVSFGLSMGMSYWLLLGFWNGISPRVLDDHHRTLPNQGIRQSARNAILMGLITGCIGIFLSVLSAILFNGISLGLRLWLDYPQGILSSTSSNDWHYFSSLPYLTYIGLNAAIAGGLLGGLLTGGLAWLQHYILRWLLWHEHAIAWNYPRFLKYVTERVFLREIGGGYIFFHRLLLDYFASHDTPLPLEEIRIEQQSFNTAKETEMGPVTTAIIVAIGADAISGLTETNKIVIAETYTVLKHMLQKKFDHHSEVVKAIESLEVKPESAGRQKTLLEEIILAQADQDSEIRHIAQQILKFVQPQMTAQGKSNAQITESSRINTKESSKGDHAL